MGDWFPPTEQDLIDIIAIWDPKLASASAQAAYGWDLTECIKTGNAMGAFKAAREAYKAVNSTANRDKKDAAMVECEACMRAFARSYIRFNNKMSDSEKKDMGIVVWNGKGSPQPKPKDRVDFNLTSHDGDHSVSADYFIEGSTKKGKGNYHAAEGRYWIRPLNEDGPIDPEDEGGRSVASTASPWKVKAGGKHRGEAFYLSMRWENFSTGKEDGEAGKGEWSPIKCIIVT